MTNRLGLGALLLATLDLTACSGGVQVVDDGAAAPPPEAGALPALPVEMTGPIKLASGGKPKGLALDGAHVYWADGALGAVLKMPKAGGSTTVIAGGEANPSGVAVRGDLVCWTNEGEGQGDGTVRRASTSGGVAVTLASDQAAPRSVTIAGESAYFTTGGSIMRVPLAGGDAVALVDGVGQGGVQGISSDGIHVFAAPYRVVLAVDEDCAPPHWCAGPGWYAGPRTRGGAVLGDSAFFTWDSGDIFASTSGHLDVVASEQDGPEAIAVDAEYLYWVNSGTEAQGFRDGSVMKRARSGGAPITIATAQHRPAAIAVDESSVFWTNQGGEGDDEAPGSLMRASK